MIPKDRRDREHRRFYDNEVLNSYLRGHPPDEEGNDGGPTDAIERYEQRGWVKMPHIPDTPLQALMEAAPHQTPEVSKEERLEFKELLADAIESLDDKELDAWELHFIGGMSYQNVGEFLRIPWTTVRDRANRGMRKIQERLLGEDSIRRYLGIYEGEEDEDV